MSVRQTACPCAMWTNCHAHLLFVVCLCLAVCTGAGATKCEGEQVLQIQETCRDANDQLLAAQDSENHSKVCQPLFVFWKCVAGNVPVCFHDFTEMYKSYLHSPHNCALSPDQIKTLQDLTMRTAKEEGEDNVTADVDFVPLSSSPPTPVDESSSSSSSSREDDGGGGGGEKNPVDPDYNTKGDQDKQTGNGGSISRQCALPVLVVSWLATFKMTSYLLHS